MSESNGSLQPRHQTLLQKYDMVVDSLSFEHIDKCSNRKELEKILKVLRSGEEGLYPALEKAAEEKLRKLSPNNHLLRVDDPVVPASALEPEHRQRVSEDMQMWASEMVKKENLLKSSEPACSEEVPAIRNAALSKAVSDKNKMNKSSLKTDKTEKVIRRSMPQSYDFWDKFDAENEILKMDLEEERRIEKRERERKLQEKSQSLKQKQEEQEEKIMRAKMKDASVGAGDCSSLSEKSFNAEQERNKGNECFRTKDYTKALQHYTKSISFQPTIDAYNNRAQTYLKLLKHNEAIADCERVLQLDPHNVKGLYRRGVGRFSLGNYKSALLDFEKALEIEPNDQNCQEYAKKACAQLGISAFSKRVRMAIQDTSSADMLSGVKSVTDADDIYYPFFNTNPNEDIVLNEIGTAKVMCRCSGTPGFMKKVRSLEDIKEHGRLCLRRSSRSKKRDISNNKCEQNSSNEENCSEMDVKNEGMRKPGQDGFKYNEKSLKVDEKVEGPKDLDSVVSASKNNNVERIKSGYSFVKFLSGIKSNEDLGTVAEFLKAENPENVKKMVGQMLDEKMLCLFIMALRAHFSLPEEWGVVQRYLHSFTQFPRFKCVSMMLDKRTKTQLESLLNEAEGHGLRVSDLLQLYGVTDCPQS